MSKQRPNDLARLQHILDAMKNLTSIKKEKSNE